MPKPNEKWTVDQMKTYIRTHKLNIPNVKLGMKKAEMIAGLKKLGHYEGSWVKWGYTESLWKEWTKKGINPEQRIAEANRKGEPGSASYIAAEDKAFAALPKKRRDFLLTITGRHWHTKENEYRNKPTEAEKKTPGWGFSGGMVRAQEKKEEDLEKKREAAKAKKKKKK